MTTSWQSEGTVIGRLRIRMPADNAMTSQHNIATVIRNADLRPSRLPASAILCLRKLRDPAPSVRWSGHDRIHPPAEWERSAVAELDRMASVAMRPVLSAVPPSAESVVFIDRAEMLACLALDWLRGDLRTNWWWATLLRQAGAETTILHEWMSSPEFIPLALEHLAARSQAVSFAKKIDDHFAAGLLSRVLYAFGIQEPRAPLDFREVEDTTATTRSFTEGQISAGTQDLPPWSAIVPEAVASLSPVQQVLLGQGLMLRRAPFIVRSEAFQRAVAEWRERAQRRTHHSVRIPTTRIAALRQGPTPGAIPTHIPSAGQTVAADSDLTRMVAGAVRVENEKERVPNQATTRPSEEEAQSPKPAITIKPFSLPDVAIAKPQADVEGLSTRYLEFKDLSSDVSRTALPHTIVSAAQFNSDLAGIFFLTNVALALGLYSDFTAPRGANLELDLWEFLYLLASGLIPAEMLEDPVGPLLLTLAGNDVETPPGSRFCPPARWSVPDSWLAAFPEFFEWREIVRDGRAQVAHPAGFLLKDEPDAAGDSRVVSLECWAGWLAAYVRARLVRALGREDATEFLCRVSGRIEVTPMHVNVHFCLANYPTEIRLAGLDRDPGWIPAAGRYVAYHFD